MFALLLNLTIVLQTFMEFHEQALVPFPLLMMLLSMQRGSRRGMFGWALVVLLIREENVLFVGCWGSSSWSFAGARATRSACC
jgi:hypothetical protein